MTAKIDCSMSGLKKAYESYWESYLEAKSSADAHSYEKSEGLYRTFKSVLKQDPEWRQSTPLKRICFQTKEIRRREKLREAAVFESGSLFSSRAQSAPKRMKVELGEHFDRLRNLVFKVRDANALEKSDKVVQCESLIERLNRSLRYSTAVRNLPQKEQQAACQQILDAFTRMIVNPEDQPRIAATAERLEEDFSGLQLKGKAMFSDFSSRCKAYKSAEAGEAKEVALQKLHRSCVKAHRFIKQWECYIRETYSHELSNHLGKECIALHKHHFELMKLYMKTPELLMKQPAQ